MDEFLMIYSVEWLFYLCLNSGGFAIYFYHIIAKFLKDKFNYLIQFLLNSIKISKLYYSKIMFQ